MLMQNCIAAKRHSNAVALRAEAQDVRRPLPKAARSKVAPVAQKTRSWTRSMNQGLTARFAEQNALPQPFAGRGMGANRLPPIFGGRKLHPRGNREVVSPSTHEFHE
jgi:hypothetical protein